MKKLISIILVLILTIGMFTACGKDNVNDSDSGKIKDFKIKHEYVDGNYYIFAKKFDNDSKAPYMKLIVKNKIITGIYFNYISSNGKLYLSDNNNNETWFYIKTLNTAVLQNQDKIKNTNQNYEDVYKIYNELLTEGLKSIKNGKNNISYVDFATTYTAQNYKYDKNGYDATLKVTYENNVISKISYTKKDSSGNIITSNNSYLKKFKDSNNINYQKYIQNVIDLSKGEDKVRQSLNDLDIDKEYNILAKRINAKAIDFDYTKYEIFNDINI